MIENFEKTYEFGGIANKIVVDVTFRIDYENGFEEEKVPSLIDTGAEKCGIKSELADRFGFKLKRGTFINTSTDKDIPAKIYSGTIIFPENYEMFIPEIGEITNKDFTYDFVIGMNVLRHADYAVSNADGKTVFTIRFPPRERIDFEK